MVLNAVGPILGTRPFIDEMMISQAGSLLMTPFAYIFHLFNPSFSGVVLFFRHLYFFLAVLTMLVTYRCLRGKLTEPARALTATLPLVLIPACLPVPAYNSLLMFFALSGQMLFLTVRPLGAGLLHSLAAFAHPSFLTGAGVTATVSLWTRVKGDFRRYMLGLLLFFALVAFFIGLFGWGTVKESFNLSAQSSTFGGSAKLMMMSGEFLGYWRRPLLVVIWAGACLVTGLAGRLNWAVAMGGLAITQDFIIPEDVPYGLQQRFVCYGLFSAFLILIDRRGWRDRENLTWIFRLWLPSFAAGLSLSFVSSNGLVMAPISWMGCLVYAFWRMLKFNAPKIPPMKDWKRAVQTAAVLFILIQAQVFTLTHFYRDDAFGYLDTPVEEGPFKGIYTTHQRRNFISDFSERMSDLTRAAPPGATVFIYDMFAAGYLLTSLKPNGPAFMSILPQWMPQVRAPLVQHFQNPEHWPDFAVEFFYFPFSNHQMTLVNPRGEDPIGDPFKDFFMKTGKYSEVFDSKVYRVLQKRTD